MTTTVHAGFIPLADCAPLAVARELGFARDEGIELVLHREPSWANIRDRMTVGAYDCAHMLAPMPLAAALRPRPPGDAVIAPMALNLNGNAIAVSVQLFDEMLAEDEVAARSGGMMAARALHGVIAKRRANAREPLTFGMVYPFSCHNYDLRYWLAAAGIDPDSDVNIIVIPPPLLAECMTSGRIDGFCVGAPWGSVSVARGEGVLIATKSELWPFSPEKVLGVRQQWADNHPETLSALIRALVRSACWLDEPVNRAEASILLAEPHYTGVPAAILAGPLTGRLERNRHLGEADDRDFIVFHRRDASFPWRSHAIWLLTQMIRWGQVRQPASIRAIAEQVYRPDLFRTALAGTSFTMPAGDYKCEGLAACSAGQMPSDFFGGDGFDPAEPEAYLASFAIRTGGSD